MRWSLAQGSDSTSASPQGPSEEKRRFLEGALKASGTAPSASAREAVQSSSTARAARTACGRAAEDDAQDLDAARDLLKGMLGLVPKRWRRTTRPSRRRRRLSPWPPRTTPRCRTAAKRPHAAGACGGWRRRTMAGPAPLPRSARRPATRPWRKYVATPAMLKYALLRSATKDGARLWPAAAPGVAGRRPGPQDAPRVGDQRGDAPPRGAACSGRRRGRRGGASPRTRARRRRRAAQARGTPPRRRPARRARRRARPRASRTPWRCSRGASRSSCFSCGNL